MKKNGTTRERVVILGVRENLESKISSEVNLEEMLRLVETAGGEVITTEIVHVREPSPSSYIGSGKLETLRATMESSNADLAVVDASLSGSQIRNLESLLGVRVIDRTELILDIFALHATTPVGKVQVEYAQLMHRKTKLRVQAGVLSGLGGGIGTRGPGETKLEVDRRRIDDRLSFLRQRLKTLHQRKQVQRKERLDPKIQHVAIVGYTNVGKSTLLNALTNAGTLVADKLFATLDTTTRKLVLPCGRHVVLTDTVGFIRRLPHEIVEAFRSTFQEAQEADLLLHLVDASGGNTMGELKVGQQILKDMDVADIPTLYVLTKKDLCPSTVGLLAKVPRPHVAVSSHTGEGLTVMLEMISEILEMDFEEVTFRFPPSEIKRLYEVRKHGHILDERAHGADLIIEAKVPRWLSGTLKHLLLENEPDWLKT